MKDKPPAHCPGTPSSECGINIVTEIWFTHHLLHSGMSHIALKTFHPGSGTETKFKIET
jgi:hypothetical protein